MGPFSFLQGLGKVGENVLDFFRGSTTMGHFANSDPNSPQNAGDRAMMAKGWSKGPDNVWRQAQNPQSNISNIPQPPQMTPSPTSYPQSLLSQVIPQGTASATQYIQSQSPPNTSLPQYYPALHDPNFMNKLAGADSIRQGLSNLLLLQGFFESGLGRGGSNLFGAKPNGTPAQFSSPSDALNYQLGPQMLGGGANKNMNLESSSAPLTLGDIVNHYSSYNPSGDYLSELLTGLGGQK